MIDWRAVWKAFEAWYNKAYRKWPEQKRKIKQLVEKHTV